MDKDKTEKYKTKKKEKHSPLFFPSWNDKRTEKEKNCFNAQVVEKNCNGPAHNTTLENRIVWNARENIW